MIRLLLEAQTYREDEYREYLAVVTLDIGAVDWLLARFDRLRQARCIDHNIQSLGYRAGYLDFYARSYARKLADFDRDALGGLFASDEANRVWAHGGQCELPETFVLPAEYLGDISAGEVIIRLYGQKPDATGYLFWTGYHEDGGGLLETDNIDENSLRLWLDILTAPRSLSMPHRRILLDCYSDSEAFGPFLAVLTVDHPKAEWLLKQYELMRKVRRLDHSVYRLCKYDYGIDLYERGPTFRNELSAEALEQLDDLFDSELAETASNEGWCLLDGRQLPSDTATVRREYSVLQVTRVGFSSLHTPHAPDINWRMCIKHTSAEVTTADLPESVVQQILNELSGGLD